jgi:hypothetical protein
MADRWFYSHGDSKIGPCSARQMRELASSGGVLPTDTVWKEGIEKGVLASKVKNLFLPVSACPRGAEVPVAAALPVSPPAPAVPNDLAALRQAEAPLPSPEPQPEPAEPTSELVPEESWPPKPVSSAAAPAPVASEATPRPQGQRSTTSPVSAWQSRHARKGRATAGRGAIIVGQDGVNVKYRKKCTGCQHEDYSTNIMPIRNGVMRVGFHCPKCRKSRDVEIHGSLH